MDKYTIVKDANGSDKILGQGGFGVVFLVTANKTGAKYALKLTQVQNLQEATQATQEGAQFINFNHPNIVRYYESFSHQERFLMLIGTVMEYYPNGSLDAHISVLPLERRLQIATGICEGLKALHSKKIIHRDLKPSNVLLDANWVPKIGDMGLIRSLTVDTMAKTKQGTIFYCAPEMFGDQGYRCDLDIWNLGLILLELSTQLPPQKLFPLSFAPGMKAKENPQEFDRLLQAHLQRPGCEPWKAAIQGALAVQPSRRSTPDQLVACLTTPPPVISARCTMAAPAAVGPVF